MICNKASPPHAPDTRPGRSRAPHARRARRSWPVWGCLLASCWAGSSLVFGAQPGARLQITTSFLPAYCFAASVAGEQADVINLTASAAGPHDFQLAPRDLRRLSQTALLVVNGLGLESWLPVALRSLPADRQPRVVELAAGLDEELVRTPTPLRVESASAGVARPGLKSTGASQAVANPHIWLDPVLAAHAVSNILVALQRADPAHAAAYADHARAYVRRLECLHTDLSEALTPLRPRAFVTYHDAFPYFVRRYELSLAGVIELVPDVEPSPKYLGQLVEAMRRNQVKVVFLEPQYSPRLPRRLAQDAGIGTATLDTLEVGPSAPGAYEEGMRQNLATLVKHLGP